DRARRTRPRPRPPRRGRRGFPRKAPSVGSWLSPRRGTRDRAVCRRLESAAGAVESVAHVVGATQDVLPLDRRGVRGPVALLVLPLAAPDSHRTLQPAAPAARPGRERAAGAARARPARPRTAGRG